MEHPMFADRRDAGRQLAAELERMNYQDPVVLALPRGGVPVGFEIARALGAPLDVLLVRKIGAPHQPELGIGAVVDGAEPQIVMDEGLVQLVGPPPGYVEREVQRQLAEIERRRKLYAGARPPLSVEGRAAIVVDDGIATGGTARAALRAIRRLRPRHLVLAVPVCSEDVLHSLAREADEAVCLSRPARLYAVGAHYRDFTQTSDEEVIRLLDEAAANLVSSMRPGSGPGADRPDR
jgi:putative phosphoribosyl transferase